MLWQLLLITEYKWQWGTSEVPSIQANFVFLQIQENLLRCNQVSFCVHHVLRVHFPFSKTVFITHPLFTARLCWRCSVDGYFPFNQGRRRHLSYPRGCPDKHGGNLLSFSTFGDQSLFKRHPVADTVQTHSAKNGLCSRYLLASAVASHDPDVYWP